MKSKHKIKSVEDILNYEFRDQNIITQALTHSSCRRFNQKIKDNESLEFLGDSVLSMCVTDILYREYPYQNEGGLTKLRSAITNNKTLSDTVTKLGLNKSLKLGPGQKANESILSDLFEALIGAVYLDGGFHNAFSVVKEVYQDHWQSVAQNNTDYKSQMQDFSQSRYKSKPEYKVINVSGPPHSKEFTISVSINGNVEGVCKGPNKKQAEQLAAKEALEKLNPL
jgi:ribonuclease III